jgi:hypothetical protein
VVEVESQYPEPGRAKVGAAVACESVRGLLAGQWDDYCTSTQLIECKRLLGRGRWPKSTARVAEVHTAITCEVYRVPINTVRQHSPRSAKRLAPQKCWTRKALGTLDNERQQP